MIHITHFALRQMPTPKFQTNETYGIEAYLDTSESHIQPRREMTQVQTSVLVYRGTHEGCVEFIDKQIFYQGLYQWVGYLVAGVLGSVLTLIFKKLNLSDHTGAVDRTGL